MGTPQYQQNALQGLTCTYTRFSSNSPMTKVREKKDEKKKDKEEIKKGLAGLKVIVGSRLSHTRG